MDATPDPHGFRAANRRRNQSANPDSSFRPKTPEERAQFQNARGERSTHRTGRLLQVTRELWEKMLEVYSATGSIRAVVMASGVNHLTVRRAIEKGWPKRGWPSFRDVMKDRSVAVTKAMSLAEIAETAETAAQKDPVRRVALARAADEATAAHAAMRIAVRAAEGVEELLEHFNSKARSGAIELPEKLTVRDFKALVNVAATVNAALDTAIRLERLRAGQPEEIVGVKVGMLLDGCTAEEYDYVRRTGHLPPRVLGFAMDGTLPPQLPPPENAPPSPPKHVIEIPAEDPVDAVLAAPVLSEEDLRDPGADEAAGS